MKMVIPQASPIVDRIAQMVNPTNGKNFGNDLAGLSIPPSDPMSLNIHQIPTEGIDNQISQFIQGVRIEEEEKDRMQNRPSTSEAKDKDDFDELLEEGLRKSRGIVVDAEHHRVTVHPPPGN